MLGISCSQINHQQAASVYEIASIFGATNGQPVSQGYYKCQYETPLKKLRCEKINAVGGGVHESFWAVFKDEMKVLSNRVLTTNGIRTNQQQVSIKLRELCDNLCHAQCGNGSWLSFMRNEINYRHRMSAWFPYREYKKYYDRLYRVSETWESDPMDINLRFEYGRDPMNFLMTCVFIISLCRVLTTDMAERCSSGKSFQYYGGVSLLSFLRRATH
jgi:hypothetical protein